MPFIRDLFTGELKEVPSEGAGRQIIFRGSLPPGMTESRRHREAVNYDRRECSPLSIKPEEATPERVASFNEEAKHHGTGAYYTKDGRCFTPTRGVQNREMRRRGMANFDAGYGDYAGQ